MLPLSKIQITIVDDSKAKKCEAGCGMDWSSAEVLALASRRIEERFGSGAQLEYINLSKPMTNPHTLELKRKIRNQKLSLPLLVIDGQPRISGQFDIRLLLDAIETELEVRHEQ